MASPVFTNSTLASHKRRPTPPVVDVNPTSQWKERTVPAAERNSGQIKADRSKFWLQGLSAREPKLNSLTLFTSLAGLELRFPVFPGHTERGCVLEFIRGQSGSGTAAGGRGAVLIRGLLFLLQAAAGFTLGSCSREQEGSAQVRPG